MLNEQEKCAIFIADVPQDPNKRLELFAYCNEVGNDELYRFAAKRKILPFVARTLVELNYNVEFWDKILNEYRARNSKILQYMDLTYKCLKVFGAKKIFVSENFGALLISDNDIGLFPSGDVDNFSTIEEKDKIYSAMKSLGCEIKEKYIEKHLIAAEFYPPASHDLPEGFYFRVDFYPLERLKVPCFIKAETFIDWDKCTYYRDTNIRLPDATQLMYICMMHTSIHSFVRTPDYRLYIDIYNLDKCKIDYSLIAGWTCCEKTHVRANVALSIYAELFGKSIDPVMKKTGKRESKLIGYVFDKKNRVLLETKNKFKILKIDIMCNDKSDFLGICEILFPDKRWMNKTYGKCGLKAYMKHLLKLF